MRDLERAVTLARRSIELQPTDATWNTLGVALYYSGDLSGSVDALRESVRLQGAGNVVDWLFLAMAHKRLGNAGEGAQLVRPRPGPDELSSGQGSRGGPLPRRGRPAVHPVGGAIRAGRKRAPPWGDAGDWGSPCPGMREGHPLLPRACIAVDWSGRPGDRALAHVARGIRRRRLSRLDRGFTRESSSST
ncbi:MAG: hypothetical protein IPK67_18240 [Planctomycetes bacterium]|nr:hypothetical protein [Planctomycetota bacterium]